MMTSVNPAIVIETPPRTIQLKRSWPSAGERIAIHIGTVASIREALPARVIESPVMKKT